MQIIVMPARIAGIQVCKDASGDIHVTLDSSAPCWNDAMRDPASFDEGRPAGIFKGAHEGHEGRRKILGNFFPNFVLFVSFVVSN